MSPPPRLMAKQNDEGDWAVFQINGLDQVLVVGKVDRAAQYASWYADTCSERPPLRPWPIAGLEEWPSEWASGYAHSVLYTYNGTPVGTLGWNGREWWFYGLDWELGHICPPMYVTDDDVLSKRFQDEVLRIQTEESDGVRDTLLREIDERIRRHFFDEDENYHFIRFAGRVRAKQIARQFEELSELEPVFSRGGGLVRRDGQEELKRAWIERGVTPVDWLSVTGPTFSNM